MRNLSWHRLATKMALAGLITITPITTYGLTFETAQHIALSDAPQLQAIQAQITVAQQSAIPAGELPDPKIKVGIDNLPLSGPDRLDLGSNGMAMQTIALMQEFPSSDKRNARVQAANARISVSEMERKIARQTVARETAQAWISQNNLELQLALIDKLETENTIFARAIQAQLASGKLF